MLSNSLFFYSFKSLVVVWNNCKNKGIFKKKKIKKIANSNENYLIKEEKMEWKRQGKEEKKVINIIIWYTRIEMKMFYLRIVKYRNRGEIFWIIIIFKTSEEQLKNFFFFFFRIFSIFFIFFWTLTVMHCSFLKQQIKGSSTQLSLSLSQFFFSLYSFLIST